MIVCCLYTGVYCVLVTFLETDEGFCVDAKRYNFSSLKLWEIDSRLPVSRKTS
jgi:hypothetical protein